jgi:hypothetical protein
MSRVTVTLQSMLSTLNSFSLIFPNLMNKTTFYISIKIHFTIASLIFLYTFKILFLYKIQALYLPSHFYKIPTQSPMKDKERRDKYFVLK